MNISIRFLKEICSVWLFSADCPILFCCPFRALVDSSPLSLDVPLLTLGRRNRKKPVLPLCDCLYRRKMPLQITSKAIAPIVPPNAKLSAKESEEQTRKRKSTSHPKLSSLKKASMTSRPIGLHLNLLGAVD